MNRNTESHFSSVPRMHIQRSIFDRSCSHKFTFNAGELIPFLTEEILPGDTVTLNTSKIVRLQTMLTPVMDNIYLDTYYFFCPNRILWKHWKEFLGENTSSAWIPSVEYTVPRVASPSGGFAVGTIADYMGYPVGINWSSSDPGAPMVLPFRAYAMICNDFFRSEDLSDPLVVDDGDSNVIGSNGSGLSDVAKGGMPYIAAKFHDYFTSALPAPQKGPNVNIAAGANFVLPVMAGRPHQQTLTNDTPPYNIPAIYRDYPNVATGTQPEPYFINSNITKSSAEVHFNSQNWPYVTNSALLSTPANLWAFGGPAYSDSTSNLNISVNSLRLAVLTQMYYEALARSGSRYEEIIEQFFGVSNPDARINHPEYLGGNRIRVNVHEVTNTAQSESDFLGDVGAQSATADTHSDFTKSFTEHGWLIGVCVLRYDHSYCQGIHQKFTRTSKWDYYNPMFSQIGEQPLYDREIYATTSSMHEDTVFGYQEAWASYRYGENRASAYMRPNVSGSFGHWTLGDNYAAKPTLSDGWIREDKTNLDRALAVTSSVAHQAWADFYFDMRWTRAMPMFSVPGAIGAF